MKLIYQTVTVIFALLFSMIGTALQAASPVGYWQQVDDVTGRPHSVVQIWQKKNVLYGKVVKGYPDENGVMPPENCTKCKGDLYNKKILGMTILSGFTEASDVQWTGGDILDPDSGKVYSCQLTLIEGGKQLKVRGYIGISLLGRTQVWTRLDHFKK